MNSSAKALLSLNQNILSTFEQLTEDLLVKLRIVIMILRAMRGEML